MMKIIIGLSCYAYIIIGSHHVYLAVYQTQQLNDQNGAIQLVVKRICQLIISSWSRVASCDGGDVEQDVGQKEQDLYWKNSEISALYKTTGRMSQATSEFFTT
jgi:hypothetical protein